jgi:hypothetical protein
MGKARLEQDSLAVWMRQRVTRDRKACDRSPRARALERLGRLLGRPLRIGVFGEPRTGKSSLINFLLARALLPPTRLGASRAVVHIRHGAEPAFFVIAPGKRHRTTRKAMLTRLAGSVKIIAGSRKAVKKAASGPAPSFAERSLTQERIDTLQAATILEIHLPEPRLLHLELFEFPQSAAMAPENSCVRRFLRSMDFALCTTQAAQAWKRSELVSWKQFGPFPKNRSILVVTHREEIDPEGENRLMTRLRQETSEYFMDCSLVSLSDFLGTPGGNASHSSGRDLYMLRQTIARRLHELEIARRKKAMAIISKIMKADPGSTTLPAKSAMPAWTGVDARPPHPSPLPKGRGSPRRTLSRSRKGAKDAAFSPRREGGRDAALSRHGGGAKDAALSPSREGEQQRPFSPWGEG